MVKTTHPRRSPGPTKRKGKTAKATPAGEQTATAPGGTSVSAGGAPGSASGASSELAAKATSFDAARDNLVTTIGTNEDSFSAQRIEQQLPQGRDTPVNQVLLQTPGVSQDSAASGDLHVRNEHANLQYRINGIVLPEGVTGFGQMLETQFIGDLSLITGALPAEFGYRTSGLVDIQTKTGIQNAGGTISTEVGSRGTVEPSVQYGGTIGQTDYFFTGSYLQDDEGIENPTPSLGAIHDKTQQERGFGYVSTFLNPDTRLTFITGNSVQDFQIPNTPNQPPQFAAFGIDDFNSARLNENQEEQNYYDVLALQEKMGDADFQLAYFARYSDLHFEPDEVGDVLFNGVASDVERRSMLNGVQGDGSYRINDRQTLRAGFYVSAEDTDVTNSSLVLPLDAAGNPVDAPFNIEDDDSKLGWLIGAYVQDEWRITPQLTLNTGIRFDQMFQYTDANQFSPRVNLVYTPASGTVIHAGYARYFTPPPQVAAAPTDLALFQNTTLQPAIDKDDPVLPERSHYFDAGITQVVLPGLQLGADAYYKRATDLLDDGQFGAALVLDAFNYAKAYNEGVELTAKYDHGPFSAYGNVAFAYQKAKDLVSNQFLFDPDEFDFIADHDIYTDHSQTITASAGISYVWDGTRFIADMLYGSGLRAGFANLDHVDPYAQVNLGVSRDFNLVNSGPFTVRFDVINVFDQIYEIRDGSGVGVFAPQFGPRRGYYVTLSQRF